MDGETPPSDDLPQWQRRRLPDNWNESQPGVGGNGWYRVDLELPQIPAQLWAVYLPRLRMNAAVYVNGVFIGDGGRFSEPIARNWNRPLYFLIPAGLLRQGHNRLHIRLRAYANVYGGLYGLRVGPDAALRPEYRWMAFRKIDLNQAFMVMTIVMALLLGTLWLRWRTDSIYGWMAATMLFWAINSTHFFVRDLPLSTWWWEWTAQVGTDGFAILLAISVSRFLGLRRPWLERLMAAYVVLTGIVLSQVELDRMLAVANVFHLGAVAVGGYMVVLLLRACWRQGFRGDTVALTVGVVVQSCLGVHDWLLQLGLWQHDHWYLMHYASPLLFMVFTWLLTSRFVQALHQAEALNRGLEQRVEEKHRELEAGYRQLRELEQRQVVATERERIMRDLHDGLGGHLVSALAMAEKSTRAPDLERTLREALDDLRLVIDSLDSEHDDLPVLLGMVRSRVEHRMTRAGLRFDWQVQDVPPIAGFGPEMALHVLRIVQEIFTNIVKHARARTVTVSTGEGQNGDGHPAGVYLEIRDDGQGMHNRGHGRGLENMRYRAQQIGGTLAIASDTHGTQVRLWLPLQRAA
jgi:signal transduction histidine kinase